jgi:hypothetical protein
MSGRCAALRAWGTDVQAARAVGRCPAGHCTRSDCGSQPQGPGRSVECGGFVEGHSFGGQAATDGIVDSAVRADHYWVINGSRQGTSGGSTGESPGVRMYELDSRHDPWVWNGMGWVGMGEMEFRVSTVAWVPARPGGWRTDRRAHSGAPARSGATIHWGGGPLGTTGPPDESAC